MSFKTRVDAAKAMVCCVLLIALAGCTEQEEPVVAHDHGHHGGHALEVVGNAAIEMEFTVDAKNRRLVIYVQDAKTHDPHSLPVDALDATFTADTSSFDTQFEAEPRSTDPKNESSRFLHSLDKLPQQLVLSNKFEMKIWYEIAGEKFTVYLNHGNDHGHRYKHD